MLYVLAPCKPKRRNTSSISPFINSRLNLPTCVTGSIDKPNTLEPIPDDCFLAPKKKTIIIVLMVIIIIIIIIIIIGRTRGLVDRRGGSCEGASWEASQRCSQEDAEGMLIRHTEHCTYF